MLAKIRRRGRAARCVSAALLSLLAGCSSTGGNQPAPAPAAAAPRPAPPTAAPAAQPAPATAAPADLTELETLVGRVALYPDDLLAIVLPASTFPLQVVEADRWVQQNKGNKSAVPKESWDESVKALINYPDVVTMMSNDLDWTTAMGEAVAADQTEVMDAVQSFRRKAQTAGNLKTDDKQTVVVEEQVVKIVQTDPEIIYVPQYNPQTVVVYQTVPYYPIYYPTPYPVYYYPYPPGYAFASGFFWGATIGWAFNWHGGHIHNDVNIDIDRNNINIDRGDQINNRPTNIDRNRSQQMQQQGRGSWQSQQSPGDISRGRTTASTRPAGAGGAATNRPAGGTAAQRPASGGGAAAAQRPATGGGAAASTRPASGAAGATNRPSTYSNTSRAAGTARSSPPSRDAFSGMSSGRSVGAYSSRGGMSRGGGGMRGGGGGRR